jgi:hypothetical protein
MAATIRKRSNLLHYILLLIVTNTTFRTLCT